MKKYAIPGLVLLIGNQVTSIAALTVAVVMFLGDIIHAAERRY